jgi:hypothetical protein
VSSDALQVTKGIFLQSTQRKVLDGALALSLAVFIGVDVFISLPNSFWYIKLFKGVFFGQGILMMNS